MTPVACSAALLASLVWVDPAEAVVGPSHEASPATAASAVMVLQSRGREAGFCTGIVVGPRAIVTAAHCVPAGADVRIYFKDEAGVAVLLPVAGVTRHPGYRADAIDKRERSTDLAVVTLPRPLPERFRAATLAARSGTMVGDLFTIAGFGLGSEGDARTSGRLREADLAARSPLSRFLLWIDDPSHSGAGACTGDSGGPVRDASGDVAALMLWSAGTGSARCGALTQALWLAPYRDWIAAAASTR